MNSKVQLLINWKKNSMKDNRDKAKGIVKITISFIGVLGNLLVIFAAIRTWKDSTEFGRLIKSVALADLIFALIDIITAVPLFWTCKWVYKTFFCKTFQGIINFAGLFALYLVTIITLERHLAIPKPFGKFEVNFNFRFGCGHC